MFHFSQLRHFCLMRLQKMDLQSHYPSQATRLFDIFSHKVQLLESIIGSQAPSVTQELVKSINTSRGYEIF